MQKIGELSNYVIEEIKQNDLISKKHKKSLCSFELYWITTWTISAFSFLVGSSVYIPIGIESSGVGLKICAIPGGIKKYMSKI